MNEEKIIEEANHYLALILERNGAGENVSEIYGRKLIGCIANYRYAYAENEELIDEIYTHCLYELDRALEPFRDYEKYIVTPEDQLLYQVYGHAYITRVKTRDNKISKE